MIKQSFRQIKGIGQKTEELLWENGVEDWSSLADSSNIPLSTKKNDYLKKEIAEAEKELSLNNHKYFSDGLPANQHWRLFKDFKETTAYLDIETTGLYPSSSIITTIAIYDGKEIKHYVNGKNLNDFKRDISQYNLLVTYNGKSFDVPFIEEFFNISLNHSHIDLRYVLKSLGYSGGLKGCEKQFGIARNELDGVDGLFAIYLWDDYRKKNNNKALDTLLAYNIEDVINLEFLMHKSYNLKLAETPFATKLTMSIPNRPVVPFSPDSKTINKIKNKFYNPYSFSTHSKPKATFWDTLRRLF